MWSCERRLRVVGTPMPAGPALSFFEEVGVTLMIFLVAAVPIASALSGHGRWGDGTLGLATLGVLLAGRDLGARLVTRWRGSRS
jgi:hypothetical protein